MPKSKKDMKNGVYNSMFKSAVVRDSTAIDSVPVGNQEVVDSLFKDMEALEFINQVMLGEEHPTDEFSGNVILTEEWAESFAKGVNDTPGLLYARGHEDAANHWASRAIPSGYIVGAKVEKGSNPRLLLRNRLIERKNEADKEFVEQTMREISAGLLSTSTGDIQKRKIVFDSDMNDYKMYAIESMKNQTNALVEHDMHASDAQIINANFRIGHTDKDGNLVSEEINPAVGRNKTIEGDETMNFTELLENVKTSLKDGSGDRETLLTALGLKAFTEEEYSVFSRAKAIEDKLGVKVDEFVENVIAERKANFSAIRDAKLKEVFEQKEVFEIARDLFKVEEGDSKAIDNEITRLKGLDSIKSVQTILASNIGHTMTNTVEPTDNKSNNGIVEV